MIDETCQYAKFGYCKYSKECKRQHHEEECEDLSRCQSIKSCMKRHLKYCKRFASGQCRFEDGCAYKHEYPKNRKEDTQNSNKVNELEKTVEALSKKVLSLEKSTNNDEQSLINNKVKELEKFVGALTRMKIQN